LIPASHSSRSLGGTGYFFTVESTRGIQTPVLVFELLDEMVAFGCRNGTLNEHFQILPLELKVVSYVFLTILDQPARFISAKLYLDKSLKMAAIPADWQKLGKFTELDI